MAQAEDTHQRGLQLEYLLFALVLCFCAVTEGFFQQYQVAAKFHLGQDEAAQGLQGVFLFGLQFAGRLIDNAERAEGVTFLADERGAGVETDMRVGNDQWIIAETLVFQRVGNHENIRLQNGVGTEGDFARGFRGIDANARFEPLALVVDQ